MQSLILGAVLFIAAVVLWALGVIGDLLAAQRVMTQKTFERVRRIELQLGRRALPLRTRPPRAAHARPARARRRRQASAARASRARARRCGCERRDRLRGRDRHRQHLRQVRLDQPRRAPHDGRLRARARRAVRRAPTPSRCSTWAAARGCSCTRWAQRLRRARASSASTWRRSRSRPAGPSAQAPNLEYRVMGRREPAVRRERVRPRERDRGARARPRPRAHARGDGALRASATCSCRSRASRCGGC